MIKQGIRKIVERSGYQLYRSDNIIYVPEHVLLKAYFRRAEELMQKKVETIFDVGANVGRFSRFANAVFPKANVYAFEPVAGTFESLMENVAGNSQIQASRTALGAKREENKKIYLKNNSEVNSLSNNETWIEDADRFEYISVDTIDNVMEEKKIPSIDILKTDTEGYDLEVLKGAEKAFTGNKVRMIVCEVAFDEKDRQHSFFNRIQEYLFSKGFRVFGFTGLEACGNIQNKTGISYCNCIFLNADK